MESKSVSKFASPAPTAAPPGVSSRKTVLAGGLVAFLVVGGAAALGYRFVDSKIKRIEDLGKRLNDLSVAKGDVESLLRRMRVRVDDLESRLYDDDETEAEAEVDDAPAVVDDDEDEITFIRPMSKNKKPRK